MKTDNLQPETVASAEAKPDSPATHGSGVTRLNHKLLMSLGISKESATIVLERINELEVELEKTKADRNRVGVVERSKYLPQLAKLKGIIARNAMQRLKGEDATELYITPDDIKDSLEVLYEYQRNHQNDELSDRREKNP